MLPMCEAVHFCFYIIVEDTGASRSRGGGVPGAALRKGLLVSHLVDKRGTGRGGGDLCLR